MKWDDLLVNVKGVGPKRLEAFEKYGIKTIGDLLSHYPKRYINRNTFASEEFSEDKPVTIKAMVLKQGSVQRLRGNLSILVVPLLWEDRKISAIFFNQPYLKNTMTVNADYYFFGKIKNKSGDARIQNPQFVPVNRPGDFFELTPVYSTIQGVPGSTIKKLLRQITTENLEMTDELPLKLREKLNLLEKKAALRKLHFPQKEEDAIKGIERLKFDEALKINLGILANSNEDNHSEIEINYFEGIKGLIRNLPYELTNGQKAVIEDITADLRSGKVMNRLVQGDVGSGKTAIAVIAAGLLAQNGYQTAYMAPTEILAQQHGRSFQNLLGNTGISVEVITGSMKAKEKRAVLERLAKGEIAILIGTHALIQDSVNFYNLGLVITDEQHRFGVRHRGRLALKARQPHTMVMSATPIPRTLALILYGDLQVSYIDELPKGRKPIKTYCYDEASLPKIIIFLQEEMAKGRQAFIICPFIEASQELEEVRDVESVFDQFKEIINPSYQISCLHGKFKSEEKEAIIKNFNQGNIQCLVATSIIEVGIDVPNVSTIVILSAERFGLSQLHQLRGRVGRGKHQSWCFLVTNSKSDDTLERMKVIINNSNGKKIAEEDFRLRGPGDYFGFKQHGLPQIGLLNPAAELELILSTKKIADMIINSTEKDLMIYRDKVISSFYKEMEEVSLN